MSKVNVLFSGVSSNIGGVETFLLEYIRHMDLNQIHFDLICSTETPAWEEEFRSLGVNIYKVPPRSKDPLGFEKETNAFFSQNAQNYDIFWCNKCMLTNIDFLKYAKKYQIPVRIIHSHSSAIMAAGIKKVMMRCMHEWNKCWLAHFATDFWACSDFAGRWFYRKKQMEGAHYRFVPNAIDVEKFRFSEDVRQAYRAELGLNGKFVMGHVGYFHTVKNHMFLLDIFHALLKKRPESVLLLIGQGNLKEAVQEKAVQLGIADKVQFLGVRKDVSNLMQAMDCFMLPSLFEGFPVVAVEAQSAGLPCYLAGNGITRQAIITDRCHFLRLEDTPEVWADAIIQGDVKRVDTYDQIVQAGFELKNAAKQQQTRLIQLGQKKA